MKEDLPNKVKNYIFLTHEDLINDFEKTLFRIKEKGLKVKNNINFPLNSNSVFVPKENSISTEYILSNSNYIPLYEKKIYNI